MGIFEVRSRSSQWRNPFRTLLNCSKSEQSNWKKDQVVLIKSTENDEGGNSYRYITSTIEEVEYREQNNNYIYLFNGQLKPLFSDIRYCMNCVVECVVCKKDFKKEIDNIKLNVKLKQPNADEDTWKNRLKLNLKNTPIIPGETKYLDEDKDVEAIWMDTPADITENKIYLITASTNIDFVPMDRIDEELKNSAEKIFGEITSRVSTEQGMYLNSIINQIKDEEIKAVLAEAVLEPKILDQLLDYIIYTK